MPTQQTTKRKRGWFRIDSRIVVAVVGILLSIVLHEVFHIIVHWGHITEIGFFTSPHVAVEIISNDFSDSDAGFEETIAYSITVVTLLLTMMLVWEIHDSKDTRTYDQIVNPKKNKKTTVDKSLRQ